MSIINSDTLTVSCLKLRAIIRFIPIISEVRLKDQHRGLLGVPLQTTIKVDLLISPKVVILLRLVIGLFATQQLSRHRLAIHREITAIIKGFGSDLQGFIEEEVVIIPPYPTGGLLSSSPSHAINIIQLADNSVPRIMIK